jgi:uncharacterized protein (UPF0335 family)
MNSLNIKRIERKEREKKTIKTESESLIYGKKIQMKSQTPELGKSEKEKKKLR